MMAMTSMRPLTVLSFWVSSQHVLLLCYTPLEPALYPCVQTAKTTTTTTMTTTVTKRKRKKEKTKLNHDLDHRASTSLPSGPVPGQKMAHSMARSLLRFRHTSSSGAASTGRRKRDA
ncbi:uncharacterized protein LY79DRAFT_573953 [Colletotrichum navitas]|uniref:Secreted protein n=1 Tax=Colletotrichum navitas TaxID=681940 RepID=A0AAD8PIZ6_9PEZI|nr:uncharacterized protein LY79DRAFT_573953 [Colletotrichum navitas]KAK1561701.1 hypothetical protein LY79DRAFT_573953 [Colletotrichum navitas]